MGDVTALLARWRGGDDDALDDLMPVVYDELRRIAGGLLRSERANHTLQPTAVVHEAYSRLCAAESSNMANRAYFFGVAATVMRRVLVDHARARGARKRGGGLARVPLTVDVALDRPVDLVALDDALDALAVIAPDPARVVDLRFFGGLTVEETASYLDVAPITVKRHWKFARAWLFRELAAAPDEPE